MLLGPLLLSLVCRRVRARRRQKAAGCGLNRAVQRSSSRRSVQQQQFTALSNRLLERVAALPLCSLLRSSVLLLVRHSITTRIPHLSAVLDAAAVSS